MKAILFMKRKRALHACTQSRLVYVYVCARPLPMSLPSNAIRSATLVRARETATNIPQIKQN